MKRLILVGGGHTHAQVLLDLVRAPIGGLDLIVVAPRRGAPYSGMVPGWLAGHYRFEELIIDIAGLCRRAGGRFVEDELQVLDPDRRRLDLVSGASLGYEVLSLNVGSTLEAPSTTHAQMLPLRPLALLKDRWERVLTNWQAGERNRPMTVTTVGGGAAGFESLLAVLHRLRSVEPRAPIAGALLTRGTSILGGMAPGAVRAGLTALARAKVTVQMATRWCDRIDAGRDLVLWATGGVAHPWQRTPEQRGSLCVGPTGFIRIDRHLRSLSHPNVYAVGDCAEWDPALPKSGVFAVRMGPVLMRNLRAACGRGDPVEYSPQRQFLALLATGDRRAIASRGRWSADGKWLWYLKDRIDRNFVRRFRVA